MLWLLTIWVATYMPALARIRAVTDAAAMKYFWNPQGILPWLEANQGLLSVTALALALAAFLVETRRANEATAEAVATEALRKSEAANARHQAKVEARRADEARQINHMLDFITAVKGVIGEVRKAIVVDELMLSAATAHILLPSGGFTAKCVAAAESLRVILPAAPLHPQLIIDVQEAANALAATEVWICGADETGFALEQALDALLLETMRKLSDHHAKLVAELRPELAHALDPQGPVEEED